MPILSFRSLWGMSSSEWEVDFPMIKSRGFDGIEASLADVGLPNNQSQFTRFFDLLRKHELKWICGIYTGWTDYESGKWKAASAGEHIDQFKEQISILKTLKSDHLPIHVNCHTGCDSFTEVEASDFLKIILRIGMELKIPTSHETHRGRILGSPWICLRMIEKFKDLRITLDISHWNVVSERLIPIDILKPIFSRVDHIHARIGTHESPQVGNPRADYSRKFTEYHEAVWKNIWNIGIKSGKGQFTITPEYGPVQDFYMPQMFLPDKDGIMQQYIEQDLTKIIFDEQKKLKELFTECSI